ncbi:MAG: DNA cytosine methyltransferase [Candidatus Marinimicrobia bacterium]|nr:DNA cytosine methyltransferase [Candidatus Neomarinimicrobiota bacterium]
MDLFAGPGGLGEGFSSYKTSNTSPFKIALSIEKDPIAHQTLKLRSFIRQFKSNIPKEYYDYLRKDKADINDYLYKKFHKEHQKAQSEAINLALGPDNAEIENLIKKQIGNNENWVLIGGPPCQAYSLIGRARMKGQENFAVDERHTLYENYLQMLAKFKPAVFVMENVKGMLSSKVDGKSVFARIMNDLSHPNNAANDSKDSSLEYTIYSFTEETDLGGLMPNDFIIKSENYGIPQKRHRVILLGIRKDKDHSLDSSLLLKSKKELVSTHEAIEDLPRLRSRISRKKEDTFINWLFNISKMPLDLNGAHKDINLNIKDTISKILNYTDVPDMGGRFTVGNFQNKKTASSFMKNNWDWFHDERIGGVLNHQSRSHMNSDIHRYLFCSVFAQQHQRAPKLSDFPDELLPNHKNVDKGKIGLFSDRFRVQLRDSPATTVTSHISKDGHYYIHYDPTQCRSLSVREAARLQTFPDNYFFEGNVTQQYHQVGNAVPPLLARQLAETVYRIMEKREQV